jgi:glycosyltransferase involved in cell wall biosynthesis
MTSGTTIPRIDVIIPLYFCDLSLYPVIRDCLGSLKEHYPELNVIVVDDCSPLEHDFSVTARNDTNLGYTATVNRGLSLSTGDVVIVANDDLLFKSGDLDRFRELKGLGIFSPSDSASGNLETFGCIWGMTQQTFKKMGLLDERFKHFYSDREYYERAKKLNVPVVKWKDIVIEHRESATYNKLDKDKLLGEDRRIYTESK